MVGFNQEIINPKKAFVNTFQDTFIPYVKTESIIILEFKSLNKFQADLVTTLIDKASPVLELSTLLETLKKSSHYVS